LARAVYSRPQLAFCDDPFSSLDNHTAQTVFNRVFKKPDGLLRQWGTTIVLVTRSGRLAILSALSLNHKANVDAVNLLADADHIITLKDGSIIEQGSLPSLVKAGGYVESLCSGSSTSQEREHGEGIGAAHEHNTADSKTESTDKPRAIPEDKRRQLGDSLVYSYFLGVLGPSALAGLLVCEVLWVFLSTFPSRSMVVKDWIRLELMRALQAVWLSWWTESNAEEPNQRIGYYLGVYAALQVLAVICFGTLIM
jgi:ATP-binding cassette, subfamily C (CFTR/MRP), member 1